MFDNVSKFLIEQYSTDFASWLLGEPIALTELSPSELSLEPIRADALILLQATDVILHCEFQTDPDPTMPFRMADYALRVYRRFPQKRLVQVVIYLRPTESEWAQQTTFVANRLRHEFEVVRLWEQSTKMFFQRPGLLPYAALSQVSVGETSRNEHRVAVLRAVVEAIDALPDRQQQRNLTAATGILAGLVLDKQLIRRVLRKELMEESVIYQELRADARAEARQEVFQEMRQEVRQEVFQEVRQEVLQEGRLEGRLEGERSLILRQLTRKVGEIPTMTTAQIETLSLTQLEALGEALLNFATLADLSAWLERLPK